jgi:Zn-finger nucleic acid-binding protein
MSWGNFLDRGELEQLLDAEHPNERHDEYESRHNDQP